MSAITPRCQECQQWLDEKHDWNGYVWFVHAKPCAPLVSDVIGYCHNCDASVHSDTPKHPHQHLWCSEACRLVLKEKRRAAVRIYSRRYALTQKRTRNAIERRAARISV